MYGVNREIPKTEAFFTIVNDKNGEYPRPSGCIRVVIFIHSIANNNTDTNILLNTFIFFYRNYSCQVEKAPIGKVPLNVYSTSYEQQNFIPHCPHYSPT